MIVERSWVSKFIAVFLTITCKSHLKLYDNIIIQSNTRHVDTSIPHTCMYVYMCFCKGIIPNSVCVPVYIY